MLPLREAVFFTFSHRGSLFTPRRAARIWFYPAARRARAGSQRNPHQKYLEFVAVPERRSSRGRKRARDVKLPISSGYGIIVKVRLYRRYRAGGEEAVDPVASRKRSAQGLVDQSEAYQQEEAPGQPQRLIQVGVSARRWPPKHRVQITNKTPSEGLVWPPGGVFVLRNIFSNSGPMCYKRVVFCFTGAEIWKSFFHTENATEKSCIYRKSQKTARRAAASVRPVAAPL